MLKEITYLAPFFVANASASFVLSKISEKKVISSFDNIKTIKQTKYNKELYLEPNLIKLVSTIEKNIKPEYLNNFYANLNNAKIQKKMKLLLFGIKGKYNGQKNTLDYSINGSLEHEIIHLASSVYNKEEDILQSGFVHYDKGFNLCKALNEGYTDLQSRRLFNKKTLFYNEEVRIAEFFELLFDKEELQKYYFTNDLVGFINHLSTFINREEVIKMLINFDLGFNLKKLSNPAYKVLYTNLELKLSEIFMKNKKSFKKQFEHIHLLEKSPITSTIKNLKRK
ncbi:MAG: hypothetical protein PHF21_01490 [Bacilli bacterium]|nr:hypothetical protein [Bacilli bacterium]